MADEKDEKLVSEDALKEAMRKIVSLPKEAVVKVKQAVPPPKNEKKKP